VVSWDAPDNPSKTLYNGHSAGSAKPLVWAHAEYVTLLRSLKDGRVFDEPPQTVERYRKQKKKAPFAIWQPEDKIHEIPPDKGVRFHLKAPARIRYSFDGWQSHEDLETKVNSFGLHSAQLDRKQLSGKSKISFTLFWLDDQRWEERNFEMVCL
jgi:glucoamylase